MRVADITSSVGKTGYLWIWFDKFKITKTPNFLHFLSTILVNVNL